MKKLLSEYDIKVKGIQYHLVFKDSLTLIDGYSGIGKTLLFKQMKKDSLVNGKGFICIDYENNQENLLQRVLNTSHDKVIVIDTAEIILNMDQRMFISLDEKNQYIVFSHVTDGFKPRKTSLTELVIKGNVGYLEYVLGD